MAIPSINVYIYDPVDKIDTKDVGKVKDPTTS